MWCNVPMENGMRTLIGKMVPLLDERQRRVFLGLAVDAIGRGGLAEVMELTGAGKNTVYRGKREARDLPDDPRARPKTPSSGRVRAEGGGRKSASESQPGIEERLLELVDGSSVGNPENPLRWTTKSCRNLSDELGAEGFSASRNTVHGMLRDAGFSMRQNRKYMESGNPGPDRDAQFLFINDLSAAMLGAGQPVVSVDCKKKELVGSFRNGGAEWHPKGAAPQVNDHDFLSQAEGRAVPYGACDIGRDEGYASVGISADTGEAAVNAIRSWWETMGRERYPRATRLMVTADGGGSNGSGNRLWKRSLQALADETGLTIMVCHFPPGTSKWNKIEHRLFSFISRNWRGRPLVSYEVVVSLIANTTNRGGLSVECAMDTNEYPNGIRVADEEIASLALERDLWHGEWNYLISPLPNLDVVAEGA